jgi:site-specific recombinase XerC
MVSATAGSSQYQPPVARIIAPAAATPAAAAASAMVSSSTEYDLVFCTRNGKPLAAGNVRRAFRSITTAAGIGEDWTPRELRHTFVSIMSDNDVPIEKITNLVGHRTTVVTETVYRHQLRPVIETGATAMNTILNRQGKTSRSSSLAPRSALILALTARHTFEK